MKMADGGFRPAYNVQFASDTQSGAVAGVAIDSNGSDMGKMAPMNEALAENYGERPRQHLIAGSVSDEEAKKTYPQGWKAPRPYLRIVPQPATSR
jgi:hypothetical protein